MKYIRCLLVAVLFLFVPAMAQAHALLAHAVPAPGCTCAPPDHVQLEMTRELDDASVVKVFDVHGKEVDKRDAVIGGMTMTVSLPPLAAGTYLVKWKAVAKDQHKSSGSFNFTVGRAG